MGLAFMSLFISNNLIGWIGAFYAKTFHQPSSIPQIHATIAVE
jgi:hypothetical protein